MITKLSFKFKSVPKVVNKTSKGTVIKRVTKKLQGICFVENGVYKIHVTDPFTTTDDDVEYPAQLLLEFTDKSYDLKGKMKVFVKQYHPEDKSICFCRTKDHATLFPGLKSNYVPMCHNWVCSGYVVRDNKQLKFDLIEAITINGYNVIDWREER